jgi:hypothetical protein
MRIPKRVAVAVSGLVFAGSAALAVGAAAPASSEVRVVAPGQMVSSGCGGCGGGRNSNRWHSRQHNHFRHHQRIIVINRNNNFGRSETGQMQRHFQIHQMRPLMPVRPFLRAEEGAAAAGTTGGGAGGGGGTS